MHARTSNDTAARQAQGLPSREPKGENRAKNNTEKTTGKHKPIFEPAAQQTRSTNIFCAEKNTCRGGGVNHHSAGGCGRRAVAQCSGGLLCASYRHTPPLAGSGLRDLAMRVSQVLCALVRGNSGLHRLNALGGSRKDMASSHSCLALTQVSARSVVRPCASRGLARCAWTVASRSVPSHRAAHQYWALGALVPAPTCGPRTEQGGRFLG